MEREDKFLSNEIMEAHEAVIKARRKGDIHEPEFGAFNQKAHNKMVQKAIKKPLPAHILQGPV